MGHSASPPPPPDYAAQAREEAAANKQLTTAQTYTNRPTQNTPWGQTSWEQGTTIDPSTGQPVTTWTQNESLTPELQHALDSQIAMQSGRSDMAQSMLTRVQDDMAANPFNWDKINANTPMGQAIDPSKYTTSPTGAQTFVRQQNLDLSAPKQLTSGNERINATGQDTRGLQQTTQTANQANFVDERKRIEDQLFARMQPEHDRQNAQLSTQLANQGITPGSEQYNQQMQQLADNQARERFNATQQGGQEQQNLQNMMMGQQQQAFGQSQASQAAMNSALQNLFGQNQGVGQFSLGAQNQAFGQDTAAQQAQNAAMMQQFQQALSSGQFANSGLAQQFAQALSGNAQNFGQSLNASQYDNQRRQQAIAEESQRRNMSLNEMNALVSGQQVQAPQMPGFQAAGVSQGPQLLQAANMQNQAAQDAFSAGQSGQQGMMSGIMGLGSTAMMVF
jgi:hypothetical protein